MSILIFISIVLLFQLSQSQTKISKLKISGDYHEISLKDVIVDLEKRYPFTFTYIESSIMNIFVSRKFDSILLVNALQLILEETKLKFRVFDESNNIIIYLADKKSDLDQQYTISGYISDHATGEKLYNVNIYDPISKAGTVTNVYGFYSLTLPENSYVLISSYLGYHNQFTGIELNQDRNLNFSLIEAPIIADTLLVNDQFKLIEDKTEMSSIDIPKAQFKNIPSFSGEVDILKTLQLLPGVQSGNEGTSGIYVRGGGPDQNLILLDGAPVYNVSHLFGFLSVFNSDAVQSLRLTKGGFPARFGGRLSSIVEVNLKEGNNLQFNNNVHIGFLSSKATIEGPMIDESSSFIISGRRSYIDVIAKLYDSSYKSTFYFYDLNVKLNRTFSDDDRLYLSYYSGLDKLGFVNEENSSNNLNWGNKTLTMRWNHIFSNHLFSNTSIIYSDFLFQTNADELSGDGIYYNLRYYSQMTDFGIKTDFDFIPNPNNYLKFGFNFVEHKFTPGAIHHEKININIEQDALIIPFEETIALDFSTYLENEIEFNRSSSANLGLRYSVFSVKNKYFTSLEPRISFRNKFDHFTLKFSYARMQQPIHLLSNSGVGFPTDLWVPATERVKAQISDQIAIGLSKTLDNDSEISLETYYKKMANLIDYREGANYHNIYESWQDKVVNGNGRSYGLELFIQKKTGRTTGWLGYTLSWSDRQFPALNKGITFPYKYDRRHDLSLTIVQELSSQKTLTLNWIYGSGIAVSLPIGRTYLPSLPDQNVKLVNVYSERNNYRMEAYHRMDISYKLYTGDDRNGGVWTFSLYNVYNRKNPYFMHISEGQDHSSSLKKVSLMPIIPSISYGFSF